MTTIEANVTKMFAHREPWDVSNSVANLGDQAGQFTWQCALEIAREHASWLISDLQDAVDGMSGWAHATGARDSADIVDWSDEECLALFVQNIASELRNLLGADDGDIDDCLSTYLNTDWDNAPECPIGCYRRAGINQVVVTYYTGA